MTRLTPDSTPGNFNMILIADHLAGDGRVNAFTAFHLQAFRVVNHKVPMHGMHWHFMDSGPK